MKSHVLQNYVFKATSAKLSHENQVWQKGIQQAWGRIPAGDRCALPAYYHIEAALRFDPPSLPDDYYFHTTLTSALS